MDEYQIKSLDNFHLDTKLARYQERLIEDVLHKVNLNTLPFTLDNVVEVLLAVNAYLDCKVADVPIVIVLGGQGSGKKELIECLVNGPDGSEKQEVTLRSGRHSETRTRSNSP